MTDIESIHGSADSKYLSIGQHKIKLLKNEGLESVGRNHGKATSDYKKIASKMY